MSRNGTGEQSSENDCTCPENRDNLADYTPCPLHDETCAHEGCGCTELCEMGPTCPGGILARLPGSGCARTRVFPPGSSDAGDTP